jgi:hypothetical protein
MIATNVTATERERRLAKLDGLRARGVDPYPSTFDRDHAVADVQAQHAGLGAGVRTTAHARVAGRVRLLRRHGGLVFITLDYFALRDDKRYFFAADGDAFLAYGFFGGTALVSGDPIGSAAARDRVVGEFLEVCRGRG